VKHRIPQVGTVHSSVGGRRPVRAIGLLADQQQSAARERTLGHNHLDRTVKIVNSSERLMATLSLETLEQRVAALEKNMARLLKGPEPRPRLKDWRQAIGLFPGDDLMKQIDEAGRAIREADRRNTKS
jgi:hypothetical protein